MLRIRTQPSHPTLRSMADVESERKAMYVDVHVCVDVLYVMVSDLNSP